MAKKAKDWDAVEAYFDYGVDLENRRVFLHGDFNEEEVSCAIKGLYLIANDTPDTIEFYLNSLGGDEYEMFGLYDVIRSFPNKVQTIAVGKCMSAGPLIIAAGTPGDRWSMPNTQWMIHMGEVDNSETRIEAIKSAAKHQEDITDRWYELMAHHSNVTVAKWRTICKKVGDTFFDADQALEYGLIDHIWGAEK